MRNIRFFLVLNVVALAAFSTSDAFAYMNGDIEILPVTIFNADGNTVHSTFITAYVIYYDPIGIPQPVFCAVATSVGTKVPYKVLTGPDFNVEQMALVSTRMETNWPNDLNAANRIAPPTLQYNCFAYATGNTGYWIESMVDFIRDGDWVIPVHPEVANRATHKKSSTIHSIVHASKLVTETVTDPCLGTIPITRYEGKYAVCGIYKTSQSAPENVYNAHHTNSYKY